MRHSPESNFTMSAHNTIILYNESESYTFKFTATFPWGQWVKVILCYYIRHAWYLFFMKMNTCNIFTPYVFIMMYCGIFNKIFCKTRKRSSWIWVVYLLFFIWYLTHWGRDKMDAISQTTCSSAYFLMKMFEFWFKFHWSLFVRVHLIIIQHCFR